MELDAQPPNAAPSATIPKIRIWMIPYPFRLFRNRKVNTRTGNLNL